MVAALSAPVDQDKKFPGIIVIHEAYGLNNQIRGVAKRYAEQGYVVLAPNLFSRFGDVMSEKNIENAMRPLWAIPPEKRRDPKTIQDLMKTMSETDRKVMEIFYTGRDELEKKLLDDLIKCKDGLQSQPNVTADKLGVTGFCFGGGMAYQISTVHPFRATVVFYGANPKPLESVANISGPVLAFYAGEDEGVNQGVPQLVEAMIKYKKDFQMKIYKGMNHAFFNETRPVYNKETADDAWKTALAFFSKNLG
jgi:carboxymethylenebutenolidase